MVVAVDTTPGPAAAYGDDDGVDVEEEMDEYAESETRVSEEGGGGGATAAVGKWERRRERCCSVVTVRWWQMQHGLSCRLEGVRDGSAC